MSLHGHTTTEFVPAIQLHDSSKRANDEDLGSFYLRILSEHGLDARESIEKMLVVDYISANFDRHWNNFGVLMDTDTREFKRAAPIFDTGESFWCNREMGPSMLSPYVMPHKGQFRPFMRRLDNQLYRYCHDLSWFDSDALAGFSEDVAIVLGQNPILAAEKGRIEAISREVDRRIHVVSKLKRGLAYMRSS